LPIFVLIWLALFFSKRRAETQQLLQEYTHKEIFADFYSNYQQQIAKSSKKDALAEELLKAAIPAITRNPSTVLDKKQNGDLPIEEVLKLFQEVTKKQK
jgi:hypothetical protein